MSFNKRWVLCTACLVFPLMAQADRYVFSGIVDSPDMAAGERVLREAYHRLGHDIDIQLYSGKKALEMSGSGQLDGELQRVDGASKAYPDLIQIDVPINFLQGGVYAITESFKVDGWHSLRPYRIGIVDGIIFAQEGTVGMNVRKAASYQQLFDLLRDGQIDVVVMPRVNGLQAITSAHVPGLKELDGVLETLFLYHYLHKKNQHLVPQITTVLKQMLLDGTTRRLRDEAYQEAGHP